MTPVNLPYVWVRVMRRPATKRRPAVTYRTAYYRRGEHPVVPIADEQGNRLLPEDAGFLAAYQRINASFNHPNSPRAVENSVDDLVTAYLASPEFKQLGKQTQQDYRLYLEDLRRRAGNLVARDLTRAAVKKRRDAIANDEGKIAKANRWVTVIRLLYAWGKSEDRWKITDNPADEIRKLKTGPGYRPWTSEEVATFQAAASPPMRLAFTLAVCTGLRRGDAVRLRWGAYRAGIIEVVTSKRGVPLRVPAHRGLRAELDGAPKRATTILVDPMGKPWRADGFSKAFSAAVAAAGLPSDCHYHGLRKTAGVYLAESGATEQELMAILGCSAENAAYYCREANKLTLAASGIAKMEGRKR